MERAEGTAARHDALVTFTDGSTCSIYVLSEKLDGSHDGVDFGDGYTPVTLHLPMDQVQHITRYRLERPDGRPVDPRVNNRDSEQVVIGSKEIDAAYYNQDFVIGPDTGGESGGVAHRLSRE